MAEQVLNVPKQGKHARVIESFVDLARTKAVEADPAALQETMSRWQQSEKETAAENPLVSVLAQGRTYAPEETLLMELEAQRRAFAMRRSLLQGALTATQVAELLGTKRQTPHDRVRSGKLLGLEDNGRWLFPYWQFDASGPNGVIDGLPEVLRVLEISAFGKASWLTIPNPYLEGRTPVQALKDEDRQRVVDIALGLGTN